MRLKKRKVFKLNEKCDMTTTLQCYGLIIPQIIGLFLITLYPICWAIKKSFYYYDGVISATRFVGFENFFTLFTKDSTYWNAWITTFQFMILKLPIELPLALFVAVLLNRNLKFKGLFRGIYYMPCIIGVAIVGVIFSNMYDVFGIINAWITNINPEYAMNPISWFSNKWSSMMVLVLTSVWQTFGTNALYFTAALSNVPEELYEYAKLEGASRWTIVSKITLPMIAPVLKIIFLLSLNGTLHTSESVLALTGGAPAGSTHTVMSYIVNLYVPGFSTGTVNIGYGCSVSLVTSILMGIIAVIYMRMTKKANSAY